MTLHNACSPSAPLQWVKLRNMQVFWPACVYKTYSDAVKVTHDTSSLRCHKPMLDAEDRIVYFFGVGPHACHVHGTGQAPNLQLCVAHEDDIIAVDWKHHMHALVQFTAICRQHHIVEENLARAERNNCFQRACQEAMKYCTDAINDEEASRVFMMFLMNAKKTSSREDKTIAESKSVGQREISRPMPMTSKPDVAATPSPHKAKSAVALPAPMAPWSSPVFKSPDMKVVAVKCWQQMLKSGWETMTQADGQVLYKMPGTQFFNFRPNVNIFDSLEKACQKYLATWIQSVKTSPNGSNTAEMETLSTILWPMAKKAGWQTMTSANETWYIQPNTSFDQCIPNVTIFRSKTDAIAKFLENSVGLFSSSDVVAEPSAETAQKEDNEIMDAQVSDNDHDKSEHEGSEEDEDDDGEEDVEDDEDEDEENASEIEEEIETKQVVTTPVKRFLKRKEVLKPTARPTEAEKPSSVAPAKKANEPKAVISSQSKNATVSSARDASKKQTQTQKPKIVIPPFNLTFGKIERELRARGWYWKPNNLFGWTYFHPSCLENSDSSTHIPGKNVFHGQSALEAYLEGSGLYDEIREDLLQEHNERYLGSPKPAKKRAPLKAAPAKQQPQVKPSVVNTTVAVIKPVAVVKRRSSPRSSDVAATEAIKFGDIWSRLSEKGWHYKPGQLEYDYFKPHCQDARHGKQGVDYFPCKSMLIEYLHSSGIWEKTAMQILRDDPIDLSSDTEDDENTGYIKTASSTRKRKSSNNSKADRGAKLYNEETPTSSKHMRKRAKQDNDFHTPTEKTRSKTDSKSDESSDKDIDDTISPDGAGPKDMNYDASSGSTLPRSLANYFTPSPGTSKNDKNGRRSVDVEMDEPEAMESNPRKLISDAIQRLSSSFTPSTFQYRDNEFGEIRGFLCKCFDQNHGSSLYISGAPGCGKSALLQSTKSKVQELYEEYCHKGDMDKLVVAHINAMALTNTSALFCNLAQKLTTQTFWDGDSAFETIEKVTNSSYKRSKTMILVLDEIDILLKKNGIESDLCRLFELAHRPTHKFILIGIANQVDFTERYLPLLKQQLPDCRPQVVIFKPYTHQTIEQILMDRLGGKEVAKKILNLHGVSFLARKVASTTGDIRLALDTCRRMLQQKLDSGDVNLLDNPTPLTDMLRLIKSTLESKSSLIIQSLPRNLQMILFASTRLLSMSTNSATIFNVEELYNCYCDVSQDAGVFKPLAHREFKSALDILSSEGLLGPNELKKQLVKLLFSPSELLQSFRNDPFFSRFI